MRDQSLVGDVVFVDAQVTRGDVKRNEGLAGVVADAAMGRRPR